MAASSSQPLNEVASCVFWAPRSARPQYDPANYDEPDDEVLVLAVGPPFRYTIPSFNVLAVEMRHLKVKGYTTDDEEKQYDMFIRTFPSLTRLYPAWMAIRDATVVDESEFSLCVKTDGLNLLPQGVLVVWECEWLDNTDSSPEQSSSSDDSTQSHFNPHIQSDTESENESEFTLPTQTHTVTIKCIGTTHHMDAQEALREASKLLQQGMEVPIKLVPEPDNQYDSKVNNNWIRVGYVVREALNYVHTALTAKKIISVKFAWVKFMVQWIRSGPGFYAGINIALNGEWPREVCQCGSTR